MKHLILGILAHVDAGKTTLSEAFLYTSGTTRKLGRVDNRDAFLDTYELERARGITIFSKQAVLNFGDSEFTLLDTPGHVDFSAEMERTLQVLDYAILVISGADGVQGHTKTLWRLLKQYNIPTFIFVNKMDQNGTDKAKILAEIQSTLSGNCVDFTVTEGDEFFDALAMCDEAAMEQYLETAAVDKECIVKAIKERNVFPCYFGSALKLEGVEDFLRLMDEYSVMPVYGETFGAKVYKISRDEQGNRLTYMKITGGSLKVRAAINEEKINQIRIYSGTKFEAVNEVEAGRVCAVTGLTKNFAGDSIGAEQSVIKPVLEPVLSYRINLPEGIDAAMFLPKLRQLEEEEPQLRVFWNEISKEIMVQLMGEVQTEVLQQLIKERFDIAITFGEGDIVYKETITDTVEGVGHFEPLRHYAEVHLLMEPAKTGAGIILDSNCSEDILDKNWQRLILTHLAEKKHVGVLTGSRLTDVKITVASGKAHLKHTEGGDFRQATYRAVRHGLMQANSVLLEPYYNFSLVLPTNMVGRAMTDFERMSAVSEGPMIDGEMAVLNGSGPVATMRNYQKDVIAYTKGEGHLYLEAGGYAPCHNANEVIMARRYNPDSDLANPASSVFCAHGAGFVVEWEQVTEYMHLESIFSKKEAEPQVIEEPRIIKEREEWIDTDEVDSIIAKTFYSNSHDKGTTKKWSSKKKSEGYTAPVTKTYKKPENKEKYLLVDGYNIIFAWEELNELAKVNIDGARGRLLDILSNYQGIKKINLIVVFDAYRVKGHNTEIFDYHNIHVVYTKEAETADQFIEKFAHENGKKYDVTVATSDGLEQIIIRGQGCHLLSARELLDEVNATSRRMQEEYDAKQVKERSFLGDLDSFKELKKEDV